MPKTNSESPQFTIRIPETVLSKLRHIAKSNCRSFNKEVELLILKDIEEFEKVHGEISIGKDHN